MLEYVEEVMVRGRWKVRGNVGKVGGHVRKGETKLWVVRGDVRKGVRRHCGRWQVMFGR